MLSQRATKHSVQASCSSWGAYRNKAQHYYNTTQHTVVRYRCSRVGKDMMVNTQVSTSVTCLSWAVDPGFETTFYTEPNTFAVPAVTQCMQLRWIFPGKKKNSCTSQINAMVNLLLIPRAAGRDKQFPNKRAKVSPFLWSGGVSRALHEYDSWRCKSFRIPNTLAILGLFVYGRSNIYTITCLPH